MNYFTYFDKNYVLVCYTGKKDPTCLAVGPGIAGYAGARVLVDTVSARASVLARVWRTVVDVLWEEGEHKSR